ncbi:hypothetical protein CEXT_134601 [Caerostris extrusa]|uniref:Uncharacterized protein n=1 Tax=Caerostris extrusa TaxID=172846 RepID=A0AAV4X157_CAEEX|nr:hypothetical protein CEXT_134601 [Caerostris extrusa]
MKQEVLEEFRKLNSQLNEKMRLGTTKESPDMSEFLLQEQNLSLNGLSSEHMQIQRNLRMVMYKSLLDEVDIVILRFETLFDMLSRIIEISIMDKKGQSYLQNDLYKTFLDELEAAYLYIKTVFDFLAHMIEMDETNAELNEDCLDTKLHGHRGYPPHVQNFASDGHKSNERREICIRNNISIKDSF